MTDFYIEHPEQLFGKPKRTIGDYVAQNGILVPRRFDSLEEARSSGLPVLVRSEHPQDYAGVSGLLHSFRLEKIKVGSSDAEIRAKLIGRGEVGNCLYDQYCVYHRLDRDELEQGVSFSLWEELGGYNRFITEDSAIQGRYHIGTLGWEPGFFNYTIVEKENVIESGMHLPEELRANLDELIGFYEEVRSLSNFDPKHCPIIEVQTVNGKNYFLQYHRGRDAEQAQFSLERPPEKGERSAVFVRGVTPPEGIVCKATVFYGFFPRTGLKRPEQDEASFDFQGWHMLTELLIRKRKAQIVVGKKEKFIQGVVGEHDLRSKLFKPGVSLIIENKEGLLSENEMELLGKAGYKTKQDQTVNVWIIADGRKAYIKRV